MRVWAEGTLISSPILLLRDREHTSNYMEADRKRIAIRLGLFGFGGNYLDGAQD